jgi:hypothetical protein
VNEAVAVVMVAFSAEALGELLPAPDDVDDGDVITASFNGAGRRPAPSPWTPDA